MDKNYYLEYFYLERSNWWFRARLNILASQIKKVFKGRTNLNILNIGVATGATSQMLAQFGNVKSVEYDADCYAFVKQQLAIDIEQGSILNLRFKNETFDLVCAFDVIEHVEDDKKAVEEMHRVCKTNGIVMVTVPAFMSLWSQHDVVNHHYRRYKLNELNLLFGQNMQLMCKSYFNSILFLPIYAVRKAGKLFPALFKRDGSGSDFGMFKLKLLDTVFYYVFMIEKPLLLMGLKLPFGVSAIIIAKKI